MTRLDGKGILETSWELLMRDERDFLLAAKASQGAASFVDVGGKRGLSVAGELELELIQFQIAQKPMLRGEVGARAWRV